MSALSFDPNSIKDYYAVEFSESENVQAPDTPKIPLLRKVFKIFSAEDLTYAQSISKSTCYGYNNTNSYQSGKRSYHIARSMDPFKVSFDSSGKVKIELLLSEIFTRQVEKTKQIMIKLMETLACELNWTNTARYLNCRLINYDFLDSSVDPLHWHSDGDQIIAKHTFIVLLSDPDNEWGGWTGGDLLYSFQLSRNERVGPVWTISYSQNDAVLFGNEGMMHKITSLHPKKFAGLRSILSVSDFGNEEEYELAKK